MRPFWAFAILANLACTNAWSIPPDAKDGVYEVVKRENGEEQHIQVATFATRDESSLTSLKTTPLEKRDTKLYCGCGFNMDHGNCDAAVADLSKQLDKTGPNKPWVNPHTSYYAIRNNVVAFACNRSGFPYWTTGQQYGDYLKRITYVCGAYIAGSDQEEYGDGSVVLGYARYKSGDDFCGAATTSPANHC